MNKDKILIAVDLDGGDKSPKAVIEGIKLAIKYNFIKTNQIVAIGVEDSVKQAQNAIENILCLFCREKIGMGDTPLEARRKKESSIHQALIGIAKEKFSAFVSMGNTAGIVATAIEHLKRIGNIRPGIAVPLPNITGSCLLLDAGALHSVKPEALVYYAQMGSIYVKNIWGIKQPIVKLVNIGEESCKGDLSLVSAYSLLSQTDEINFCGNIEPDRIFVEPVNVAVCPGLIGNTIIKTGEGVLNYLSVKLGYFWKIISFFHAHYKRMDAKEIGGAICLGFDGIVIIGHGKSDPISVANAIRRARLEIEADIIEKIKKIL